MASAPAAPPAVDPFGNIHNDPLYDLDTYQKLRDITVDVSWKSAPLSAALRDLTLMVRTTHPVRGAINFWMSSSASPADRARRVSLVMKGVPVYSVLEYLSQQASFTIKVHSDVVLVMPEPVPQTAP